MNKEPYVLAETDDFAVLFKPPKMHSVPLAKKQGGHFLNATLLDWYESNYPPVIDLMHRLDYETHGLVLLAKNAKSFDYFKSAQDKGEFVKEYSAVCRGSAATVPEVIESYFRPYGPGRKLVRPVTEDGKKHKEVAKDNGGFYRTEIVGRNGNVLTVRIRRGFRHQIRSHLCWIGLPILNDPLYGEQGILEANELALRAHALFFSDPSSGEQREYRIAPCDNFLFNHGINEDAIGPQGPASPLLFS